MSDQRKDYGPTGCLSCGSVIAIVVCVMTVLSLVIGLAVTS